MMKRALDQFRDNLSRARALSGLAKSLETLTTTVVDSTDIYRASLVLGVSALDQFVHEFVRFGMLEVHQMRRPVTPAISSFRVPLGAAMIGIVVDPTGTDWLDATIRDAHSWRSFQHPDKIAEAIRLVSTVTLWEEVAKEVGSDAKVVRARLTAIVDRRNQIAHEADMDPTNPGNRWPIDYDLTQDALDYLDRVVHAIYHSAV
jgi:RiboL-PSP-HEPN